MSFSHFTLTIIYYKNFKALLRQVRLYLYLNMIRIYISMFMLLSAYVSTAQTDTLQSLIDTDIVKVQVIDTPLKYISEQFATEGECTYDTVLLENHFIYSAVAEAELASVIIAHDNKCIVWDFFDLFAVHKLDIDTIILNQKTYLKIKWEQGDGRWWWQDRSEGITIVDLNERICILHLITDRSLYETNAENKHSNAEPLVDCNYTQRIHFKNSLLIIEPAKIERHTNNDESNDCPRPYISGKYIFDGIHWIRVD